MLRNKQKALAAAGLVPSIVCIGCLALALPRYSIYVGYVPPGVYDADVVSFPKDFVDMLKGIFIVEILLLL